MRQQRVEFGILLPLAGAGVAASGGPSLLMLQSLLTLAFSPNVAAGRSFCPPKVREEVGRHNLEPSRAIYCAVQPQPSAPGQPPPTVHLNQGHLAHALKPVGELEQARLLRNGRPVMAAL